MPNKIPKIGIFFDYDITIRHFLLNDTFRELGDEYQLVYVFNIAKDNSKTGIFYDVSGIDKISKRFIHVPRRRMGRWYHLFIPELLSRHRKSRSFSAIIDQAKLNHSSKLFLFYR